MTDELELRASDADRERTVTLLRDHSAQGRLTLDEFAERMEQAYEARTVGELEHLTRDLPAIAGAAVPQRTPKRFTVVVFGDAERTGRWRVGRHSAFVLFGNADLDLRQAVLDGDSATITAFVLFGNIDVYVPDEVDTELGGLTIFGHRRDWGSDPPRPGAPLVHVRVFALFGTADLWRAPRELAQASWREVTKALRKRQPGRRGAIPPPPGPPPLPR